MSSETTYSGYIGMIGRPNVGKSTLMNTLLGSKLSITSHKAQTTRHQILGVRTEGAYQMIFVDTPGIHANEKSAMNQQMNKVAVQAISDVDVIVWMVEACQWTPEDDIVLKQLKQAKAPILLVVSKVDLVKDKSELLPFLQEIESKIHVKEVIPLSSFKAINIDVLENTLKAHLNEDVHYFPDEQRTDRSEKFLAAEIIREKLMRYFAKELPYSSTVDITDISRNKRDDVLIKAIIWVEREGQKHIVIGKGGEKIKSIGIAARKDLAKLFNCKVHLDLWVKVKRGWSDDTKALKNLGIID